MAILKESSRKSETEGESDLARQMKALEEKRAMESWKKPTDEMKYLKSEGKNGNASRHDSEGKIGLH